MKLIIQIPCYNEAETLEIALNALPKHIDGIDEIEPISHTKVPGKVAIRCRSTSSIPTFVFRE